MFLTPGKMQRKADRLAVTMIVLGLMRMVATFIQVGFVLFNACYLTDVESHLQNFDDAKSQVRWDIKTN